MFHLLLIKGRR